MDKLIENCEFIFECPLQWQDLTATDTENTRFCEKCSKSVIFCKTDKELRKATKNRECVAIHTGMVATLGVISWPFYKKID